MAKIKALLKDKKVVTGLVAAFVIITGVVVEPQLIDKVVEFIVSLTI